MSIRNSINNIEDGQIRYALHSMIDFIESAYNFHTHSVSGGTTSSFPSIKTPEISISEEDKSKIE